MSSRINTSIFEDEFLQGDFLQAAPAGEVESFGDKHFQQDCSRSD